MTGRSPPSVLFVAPHAACMYAMLPVAERLREEGKFRPVFFVFREGKFTPEQLRDLERRGIEWIKPTGLDYISNSPSNYLAAWLERMSAYTPGSAKATVSLAAGYARILKHTDEVLSRENVVCLVLVGDRHLGWETSLIRKGNEQSIPSLIVPFAASDPRANARTRMQKGTALAQYRRQGMVNRLAAALFPLWVYEYRGESLLFYPGSVGLVGRLFGIMPARPWSLVGGSASRVAVENKKVFEQYVREGRNPDEMAVTGYPLMDACVIDEPKRIESVRRAHGVESGETMVLFAVPQMAEHGLLPWDEHSGILEAVIGSILQSADIRLVLSLHPKSDRGKYAYLEEGYPLRISDESVYSLISACDIFVAGSSSTVIQAIGLSKPSVVIDYFGTAGEYYEDAPGVIIVGIDEDARTVSSEIERMITDANHYQALKAAQAENRGDWVALDRRCTDRVVAEIHTLIDGRTPESVYDI